MESLSLSLINVFFDKVVRDRQRTVSEQEGEQRRRETAGNFYLFLVSFCNLKSVIFVLILQRFDEEERRKL